jgi:hypothetical protein
MKPPVSPPGTSDPGGLFIQRSQHEQFDFAGRVGFRSVQFVTKPVAMFSIFD